MLHPSTIHVACLKLYKYSSRIESADVSSHKNTEGTKDTFICILISACTAIGMWCIWEGKYWFWNVGILISVFLINGEGIWNACVDFHWAKPLFYTAPAMIPNVFHLYLYERTEKRSALLKSIRLFSCLTFMLDPGSRVHFITIEHTRPAGSCNNPCPKISWALLQWGMMLW